MKIKIISLFIFANFWCINIYAQRTVALHSSSVSIYSGVNPFIDAYNAAQNGDTLYLPGGAFAAPSLINKQLYIYGAGYHPDSTQTTNPTLITGNFNIGENADNLMIEGVQFANTIIVGYNVSASFMSFKRCRLNSGMNFAGTGSTNISLNNAFVECIIIGDLSLINLSNSTVSNSIIQNRLLDSKSNVFKNNIYLYTASPGDGVFHRPYYNEFSNNIFTISNGAYLIYDSNDGNLHFNNLYVATSPNYGANPIASNNYLGVTAGSIYVNQSGTTFNYAHDYHLQNPTTYLGNESTQVGIYGGAFPYKAGAVPINPHIGSKIIAPQTTPNGELQINIRVNAQNN
jgi:hypothetical protein